MIRDPGKSRLLDFYRLRAALLGHHVTQDEAAGVVEKFCKTYSELPAILVNMQRRIAARSPLNTLQEQQVGLPHEEWRILLVCMLLNRTHGRQVRPMLQSVFANAKSPQELIDWQVTMAGEDELRAILRPLGFQNRRARALSEMSLDFSRLAIEPATQVSGEWARALRHCGQYAVDSLNVFRYNVLKCVSSDTWINEYIAWRASHEAQPGEEA